MKGRRRYHTIERFDIVDDNAIILASKRYEASHVHS